MIDPHALRTLIEQMRGSDINDCRIDIWADQLEALLSALPETPEEYECPVCGVKASEAGDVAASCEEAIADVQHNPALLIPTYERLSKTFAKRAIDLAAPPPPSEEREP